MKEYSKLLLKKLREMNNKSINSRLDFLVLLLLILLVGCTDQNYDRTPDIVLDYALNYYQIEDVKSWENVMEIVGVDTNTLFTGDEYFGGYYAYKKQINDTIFDLYFIMYVNETDTIFAPYWLYKRFIQDGFQHILSFDKGGDTLYYYKAELFKRLLKFFVRGEYYYKYQFYEFDNYNERIFFEQNIDSLTRIKGMNLPPLPIVEDPNK